MAISDRPPADTQMTEPAEPRPAATEAVEARRSLEQPGTDEVDATAVRAETGDGRSEPASPSRSADRGGKGDDDRALAVAFRETHERRIHAFALLLTLGDRPRAARLADEALNAARPRVATLLHPERGAAWLRQRVLRRASRGGGLVSSLVNRSHAKASSIPEVGADGTLMKALASLPVRDRAALILNDVEGIRELDIADVLGIPRADVDKTVRKARARYGRAYLTARRADGTLDQAELPDVIRDAARPGLTAPTKTTR